MSARLPMMLVLAAGTIAARASDATTFSWINPSGGAATTTINWSPAGYPHALDGSVYGLASSYSISWVSPADTLVNVQVTAGSPAFAIANRLGVAGFVGVDNGATMTLSGGTIWTPQVLINDVTNGFLIATGATSELDVTDVEHGCTGCPGPGYGSLMHIMNGARLISRGPVHISPDPGATEFGEIDVHGRGSLPFPFKGYADATLVTLGGSPDVTVCGSKGYGELLIYDAGYVNIAGRLFVAKQALGSGAVDCSANGGLPGDLVVQGETFVGANAEAGVRGGSGGVGVEDAYANFVGRMWLGDPDDPPSTSVFGSLGVSGTANVIVSGGITMSAGLTGGLGIGGGITQVIGGPSILRQYDYPIIGGDLWFENATITDLWSNPVNDPRAVMIGQNDTGRIRVAGAGTTLNVHGDTQVGDAGTSGVMEADSSGTTHFIGAVAVNGGPNGDSFLTVNGSGSVAAIQDSLVLGGATGYFGQAVVETLGVLTVTGPLAVGSSGNGQMTIDGATLTAGATRVGAGGQGHVLAFDAGHATLAGVGVGPGAGNLEAGPGGHIDVTDHLDVFPSGGFVSVDSTGILNYTGGSHALNLSGAGTSGGEIVVNAGGSLVASPEIDVRGFLSFSVGNGIPPSMPNHMRVTPTSRSAKTSASAARAGVQSGFSGIPGLVQCGLTRVLDFGTLQGLGVVKGRLHVDSGTGTILVLGDDPSVTGRLIAGDSTRTDGFTSIGQTTIATGDTLMPLDSDGADLGKVHLGGGVLQLLRTGHLKSGFRLDGNGTIAGSLDVRDSAWVSFTGQVSGDLALAGTLDMGAAVAALVVGSMHDAATGITTLKVGHVQQDLIFTSGPSVLGGTIDLRSLQGDTPHVGDTLTVMVGGPFSGSFASVKVNGHPAAGATVVLVRTGDVRVAVVGAVTGVGETPATIATPSELRFAAMGAPREAALELDLPAAATVHVTLYDVTGREAAQLAEGELAPGRHRFALAERNLGSGMYFARAVVTGADRARALTARVVVLR